MISVILVEDDNDLRESLEDYLRLEGMSVVGVGSGQEFYSKLEGNQFSVAILDIGLPDQSGLVLAQFARENTAMGIIILTALDTVETRVNSYEQGGDLFLSKPVDNKELVAAIKNLAARRQEVPGIHQVEGIEHLWTLRTNDSVIVSPTGVEIPLTYKEFKFLQILIKSDNAYVSRETIQLELYRRSDLSTSQSLDSLVLRLRKKFNEFIRGDAPIKTAYGVGYNFTESANLSETI